MVELGEAWSTGAEEDLTGVVAAGVTTTPVSVMFRTLDADYNKDLSVDIVDFALFSATFGSTTDLRADGNGNGMIDAADYTVWRDSPELGFPFANSSGLPTFSVAATPEPSGLVIASCAVLLSARRRGRR